MTPGPTPQPFTISQPAADDLVEILDWLAQRSPGAADQVRREIDAALVRLAEFPQLGHIREDLTDRPYRFWKVYSYLITYRTDTDPPKVVRVLHGARDVARELRRPER